MTGISIYQIKKVFIKSWPDEICDELVKTSVGHAMQYYFLSIRVFTKVKLR